MNRKLGMAASLVTLAAVAAFAVSMLIPSNFGSYLSSLFIAWGFVPLAAALAAYVPPARRAASRAGMAFAALYAMFISLVYFTQLTTLRLDPPAEAAMAILDYTRLGSLFFNLDLLGYAFMAMSTFFLGLALKPERSAGKALRWLLLFHGVFAVSCVVMPMLGVFKPDMEGGVWIGTLILEFWCAYFIPVSILAFFYFKARSEDDVNE